MAAARLDQVQATTNFNVRSLISSHVGNSGISLFKPITDNTTNSLVLEPKLVSTSVTSTRMPEHKIDMALEMLDVNSMDAGRYRAMVIQNPGDPQAIKGFLKIAHVISARGVTDQLDGYNKMSGGFVMGGYHREALIKYGGLVEGYDFWKERLLLGHPIFKAFFTLKGGTGGLIDWRDIVNGYFIRDRMVGIDNVGWGSNPRYNQMAVNVIIYALTQEGSITQRLMQRVN